MYAEISLFIVYSLVHHICILASILFTGLRLGVNVRKRNGFLFHEVHDCTTVVFFIISKISFYR